MVKFWKKYHKWIGIISVFFILMFAVSGVLLNHRQMISGFEISRKWLPEKYHLKNWNNGAIKGTLPLSADSILMYGASGIWLADSLAEHIRSFDSGIREGIDNRSFRALVKVGDTVFGIATYELYRLDTKSGEWQNYTKKLPAESSLTDLCAKQDTLFVVSRSHIFKSLPPYESFEEVPLYAATDYSPKVSLFKTMWILHSGEIFGLSGKLVVDMLGIIIIVITVTGLFITLLRMSIRRRKKKQKEIEKLKNGWKFSLKWHNRLGYSPFVMLLFIVITGTFLRPPLLIPIARAKVSPIPYSTLDSKNTWNEKLRTLRYDAFVDRWLLYSSDGFYEFANFKENPKPISKKPPISVMGVTVLDQKTAEIWLVGSFSGLYEWNAETGVVHNAFTGEIHEVKKTLDPPSFDNPINGYSNDFAFGEITFDYVKGALPLRTKSKVPIMPITVANAPMSLWHFALELHVGRMYPLPRLFAALFVFLSGLLFLFVLISGYIVYKRRHKKRKKKQRQNMQQKEAYWSKYAKDFEERNTYVVGKVSKQVTLGELAKEVDLGKTLELACGNGTFSIVLAKNADSLTCTDFSDEMVAVSRLQLKDFSSVKVEKANCFELPYGDETFDTVFMANLLHVIATPEKAVAEAKRVLKKGGQVIAIDYTGAGMTVVNKFKMMFRYIKTYGKPPKSRRKIDDEVMEGLLESNGLEVIVTKLVGKQTKAAFGKAKKVIDSTI